MKKPKEFWVTSVAIGDPTGGKQHWAFTKKAEYMQTKMIHCREVIPLDWDKIWKKYNKKFVTIQVEELLIQQLVEHQLNPTEDKK